jgi:hypothetical protein
MCEIQATSNGDGSSEIERWRCDSGTGALPLRQVEQLSEQRGSKNVKREFKMCGVKPKV